ncbi:hypothetical protein BJP40_21010 [Streptomyces sp. CC53]|uniref:hypothetical protein n=1 Tax=unclassified Streptomyces TaxID=2593676 RepID=UPI0008DCC9DF|nr:MULTISPECIES: hypothetical protein [unclassified Streptomyces]OII62267.1 hypothetical protein BJP39_30090 [Streptomyces sp. CC77]OII64239.1 hypothetical protein BJP40_21010 [Streptomyces sp. CC53]
MHTAHTATYTAEITTTPCPRCQATVAGVNGRYACTFCGWCSPYVPPEAAPVCTPCRDGCTAHPTG